MENFYFICYKSLFNLEMTLKHKVIGFGRTATIPKDMRVVMLYRKDKEWYVVGDCYFGEKTEDNPFEEPEKYPITYSIKDVRTCKPVPINAVLRKQAGQYWGLLLQHSMEIKDPIILDYVNNNFDSEVQILDILRNM